MSSDVPPAGSKETVFAETVSCGASSPSFEQDAENVMISNSAIL